MTGLCGYGVGWGGVVMCGQYSKGITKPKEKFKKDNVTFRLKVIMCINVDSK